MFFAKFYTLSFPTNGAFTPCVCFPTKRAALVRPPGLFGEVLEVSFVRCVYGCGTRG